MDCGIPGLVAGALSETVEAPEVEELSTAAKATGDNKTPSLSRLPYAGGLLARGSSNPPRSIRVTDKRGQERAADVEWHGHAATDDMAALPLPKLPCRCAVCCCSFLSFLMAKTD